MKDFPRANWSEHVSDAPQCGRCINGFPKPCPCGGQVHGELLDIPDDGFLQLTHCERCEALEDG